MFEIRELQKSNSHISSDWTRGCGKMFPFSLSLSLKCLVAVLKQVSRYLDIMLHKVMYVRFMSEPSALLCHVKRTKRRLVIALATTAVGI